MMVRTAAPLQRIVRTPAAPEVAAPSSFCPMAPPVAVTHPQYPRQYGSPPRGHRDMVIAMQGTPKLRKPYVPYKPCPYGMTYCPLTQRCEFEDDVSCTRDPHDPRGYATHYVFDELMAPMTGALQKPHIK